MKFLPKLILLSLSLFHAYSNADTCDLGIYRASDGNFVSVTGKSPNLRLIKNDGQRITFANNESGVSCDNSVIRMGSQIYHYEDNKKIETRFSSEGAELAGQLMLPKTLSEQTPLVIYAHGSESYGWIGQAQEPMQSLGRGVAVFIYDKRGTGSSEGNYNQNFPLLAKDLVKATQHAKRLYRLKTGFVPRVGLIGLSQGGWVAPLASLELELDFLVVGYGLAIDIAEEDAEQIQLNLRRAGYDQQVLRIAKSITDVTTQIVKTNYQSGLDELATIQGKYQQMPWYSQIKGSYTGVLLNMSVDTLRKEGVPFFNSLQIDWSHNPVDVLNAVKVPQLWALAKMDTQAPIAETLKRLRALQTQKGNVDIVLFDHADHGMKHVHSGDTVSGYYDLMADYAKNSMKQAYGESEKLGI